MHTTQPSPHIEIGEEQQQALVSVLHRIRTESNACCVLLAGTCGRPLGFSGGEPAPDLDALASLAASAAAAASRFASLLGEEDVHLHFQRGGREVIQLTPAAGFVLAAVFPDGAPQGIDRLRARLRQRRALSEIATALETSLGGAELGPFRDLGDAEIDTLVAPMAPGDQ